MQNRSSMEIEQVQTEKASSVMSVGGKDPAAVSLGRRGGLKGGKARAAKLSAERRKDIARHAALVRWDNKNERR
jgi:hypothetical protein